eukprot:scaffold58886_cov31-Tisochrysis_lutea.AAC.1
MLITRKPRCAIRPSRPIQVQGISTSIFRKSMRFAPSSLRHSVSVRIVLRLYGSALRWCRPLTVLLNSSASNEDAGSGNDDGLRPSRWRVMRHIWSVKPKRSNLANLPAHHPRTGLTVCNPAQQWMCCSTTL